MKFTNKEKREIRKKLMAEGKEKYTDGWNSAIEIHAFMEGVESLFLEIENIERDNIKKLNQELINEPISKPIEFKRGVDLREVFVSQLPELDNIPV